MDTTSELESVPVVDNVTAWGTMPEQFASIANRVLAVPLGRKVHLVAGARDAGELPTDGSLVVRIYNSARGSPRCVPPRVLYRWRFRSTEMALCPSGDGLIIATPRRAKSPSVALAEVLSLTHVEILQPICSGMRARTLCAIFEALLREIFALVHLDAETFSERLASRPRVERSGFISTSFDTEPLVSVLRSMLLPILGRSIYLGAPAGRCQPMYDGRFHVHLYSTTGAGQIQVPETGLRVLGRDSFYWRLSQQAPPFGAPPHGVTIRDHAGLALATLVGRQNLYLHLPFGLNGNGSEELRFTISEVARVLRMPAMQRSALLKAEQSVPRVLWMPESRNPLGDAVIAEVERRLLPAFGRRIQIFGTEERIVSPGDEQSFRVYLYAAPRGFGVNRELVRTALGAPVNVNRHGYLPTGDGVAVIDPDTGFAVGELFPNDFYFMLPLQQAGYDPAQFAEKLVSAILRAKNSGYQGALSPEVVERSRDEFVRVCLANRHAEIARLKAELESLQRSVRELERSLIEKSRAAMTQSAAVSGLEAQLPEFADSFRAQLEQMASREHVVRVWATSGQRILVQTDFLTYVSPENRRETPFGRFLIVFRPYDHESRLLFFNLDFQPEGFHHPHVTNNGVPCLGNYSAPLAKHIARLELAMALELAIRFLLHYNGANPYYSLPDWRRAIQQR